MTVLAAHTDTYSASTLRVQRCGHSLGAEVSDVDLGEISLADAEQIAAALRTHKVLIFRGQELTPAGHTRLANLLGAPTPAHPVLPGFSPDFPHIWQIDSTEDGARNDVWHTDVTFVERPPMGSILRAIDVPPYGGDTSWGCLEAAYESLPAPLQQLAETLEAVHDGTGEFGRILTRQGGNEWEGHQYKELKAVTHPVVRVHPETGRKCLFVNRGFTTSIVGFEPSDSRQLLELFFNHIARPEHTIRHRWQHGDVVLWDNRNTVHYANDDVVDFRRLMHRITLAGDVPVGVAA